MSNKKPCLFGRQAKLIVITGPTASGKTGLSIELALWLNQRLNQRKSCGCLTSAGTAEVKHPHHGTCIEIVSADSRQVYKEMDIGTAKPLQNQKSKIKNQNLPQPRPTTPKGNKHLQGREKSKCKKNKKQKPLFIKGIPHYLFNVVKPNEKFDVATYKKLAEKKIQEIIARGKIPFLVGGSPFYVFSITKGWTFPKVEPDWDLREKLQKKPERELFQQLKKLDPGRAQTIDKQNKRRLIRALEIVKEKGEVPVLKAAPKFDCLTMGVKLPEKELKRRIFERADRMIEQGLEQEVKKLVQKYGWQSPALRNTIGYQEWQAYFENKISKQQVIEKIKTDTWQFSKRQLMWFKREKNIHWLRTVKEAKRLVKEWLDAPPPLFV